MRLKFPSQAAYVAHQAHWMTLEIGLMAKGSRYFSDEDICLRALTETRWPQAPTCPRCNCCEVSTIATRSRLQCAACRYQFTVTSGTFLQNSKLPLAVWFEAADKIIRTHVAFGCREHITSHELADACAVQYMTAIRLKKALIADLSPGGPSLIGRSISHLMLPSPPIELWSEAHIVWLVNQRLKRPT